MYLKLTKYVFGMVNENDTNLGTYRLVEDSYWNRLVEKTLIPRPRLETVMSLIVW